MRIQQHPKNGWISAGFRPLVIAAGWVFLIFLTLMLVPGRSFGEADPCEPEGCGVVSSKSECEDGGSLFLTNATVSPIYFCLGSSATGAVSVVYIQGTNITTYTCVDSCGNACTNGCPPPETNIVSASIVSTAWSASLGTWSASGTNWPPIFSPTNCGEGTITFFCEWRKGCGDTNISPSSSEGSFKVLKVDIEETQKFVCACDTASFSMASNSCDYGVLWEVITNGVPGEPTVVSNVITAGTNCGSWMVIGRSALNTNCADSATLTVVKVGEMSGGAGTLVSTNPYTYIVCPAPSNSPNPFIEICATPCPAILESNLPPCWQMSGGVSKTNANGLPSRICSMVDLRQLGTHTVTATAGDCSSNSVVIIVQDTNPPTVMCPANITANTRAIDCNARVLFTATATDNCPGTPTITCTPPSGSFFPKGTNTVTCTATDAAGNTSEPCTFTVTVVDNRPPTIVCSTNITVCGSASGATVTYPAPTINDNCGRAGVTYTCVPPSGSTFPLGPTIVTCTATDAAGNTSVPCTFTVTVVALGTSVEARRSSAPQEGFFPVKYGEHFEVGGTYEFEMLGGSTTPNPKLRYQVWDLDGLDDLITTGAGILFSYTWAMGVDEGDAFVRFYCDSNGDGTRNLFSEDYIDSEEFWVQQNHVYNINVQYSDLIVSPISVPIIQTRFAEASNLLKKKNSADDWRACVTYNIASVAQFVAGASRPDPVDVNIYSQCSLHLTQTDVTFVNTLQGAGGATWGLNWHDIIIDWSTDFTWLERAIAHEMGHGVGLDHPMHITPQIMQGGLLVPADMELLEDDVNNYDNGP